MSFNAAIVAIGNSKGVRIPKPLLEQCGLKGKVELVVEVDGLKLRPRRRARAGWERAFALLAAPKKDRAWLAADLSRWEREEWEWS